MLLDLLRRLAGGARREEEPIPDAGLLEHAVQLMMGGDKRGAIKAYRDYLRNDPSNVRVLNDLGACLAEIGDLEQASASFELAHSLDDTFIPAMVNHAKLLVDHNKSAEALPFLERAKVCNPTFLHTDNVMGQLLLKQGESARARAFQLKSWLADFDNLRTANANLFWLGYDEVDDEQIAAEHRFWAETVKPLANGGVQAAPAPVPPADLASRRIRLGYWSPDIRNHSVRYFFRPLLEGHDRERFEIFLYHDFPGRDVQTDLMEPHADHFHEVHDLTDPALVELIQSHDLDILVDLAGHTSHNRVNLLQARLALLQVNALGYPPTTGLASVDFKLLDRHVLTPEADRFYAERPLPLATSFWCFDPKESAPVAPEPPVVDKGHVTFGAVGNVAKITEPVARSWVKILERVPDSRLLVRSVSFQDELATKATRERLARWGLPLDRLDLRQPEGGQAFFESYNGIDIILDTFPFNGGTTTCFATYMGVPVVTIAGRSLISRMGLSMMANLGEPGLAVPDVPSYIDAAVRLAGDTARIRRFKHGARATYESTPLGNGKLFAREFEAACLQALQSLPLPARGEVGLPVLPAGEIIRRAYAVLGAGQAEAGQRIVAHCLKHYPDAGAAHLLHAQLLVWGEAIDQALTYLEERRERFSPDDQTACRIAMVRMFLLQGRPDRARATLAAIEPSQVNDPYDRKQIRLYEAATAPADMPAAAGAAQPAPVAPGRLHVLVPCDESLRFEEMKAQFSSTWRMPPGWDLTVERCEEARRIAAYQRAFSGSADVVVLVQKNVEIHQPEFPAAVIGALHQADCVGFAGALRWSRLDWRYDEFAQKAGGFISPSSEKTAMYEVHLMGTQDDAVVTGAAVLDGAVLAVRPGGPAGSAAFDDELLGCETLLEERWSHQVMRAGGRLAIHRHLGVYVAPALPLDASNRTEARLRCARELGFSAFEHLKDDHTSLSVPVPSIEAAVAACDRYFHARAAGSSPT